MKSYQATEAGKPLVEVESPTPEPTGSQVIIKTIACGVCHSDVHIHSGAFDLGGGNELPVPVPNPFTLGHEVFGEVVAVGPEATNINVGDKRIVYPWIGCSKVMFVLMAMNIYVIQALLLESCSLEVLEIML